MLELFKSTDSGFYWDKIYTGPNHLYSLDFRDENIGLFGGQSFMSPYEVIKSITDGGLSWDIWGSWGLETLYDIYCIDDSTAYAINYSYVCKTIAPRRMNTAYYFSDTQSLNKMFLLMI